MTITGKWNWKLWGAMLEAVLRVLGVLFIAERLGLPVNTPSTISSVICMILLTVANHVSAASAAELVELKKASSAEGDQADLNC